MTTPTTPDDEDRRAALRRLGLFGLLARWEEVRHVEWLPSVIAYEQSERQRRMHFARLGSFKPLCDFDWHWPKKIDRAAVEELSSPLSFPRPLGEGRGEGDSLSRLSARRAAALDGAAEYVYELRKVEVRCK